MATEDETIDPQDQSHPLEALMEASLVHNTHGHETTAQLLEALLEYHDKNDLTPLLEAQIILGQKSTEHIIQAIKDIPKTEIPEQKEPDLTETNKLLAEITDELKKKDVEEVTYSIDDTTRELLRGPKGDTGDKGDDGYSPSIEELIALIAPLIPSPINGINGKDGNDGSPDSPLDIVRKLESLEGEDRLDFQAIKGLPEFQTKIERYMGNGLGSGFLASGNRNVLVDGTTIFGNGVDIPLSAVPQSNTIWGSITGDINLQTDLLTLLNAKANIADLATVAFTGNYNDLSGLPNLTGTYVPYSGANNNVNIGAYTMTATEFLVGDSSAYTPPAPAMAFYIQDFSNTTVAEIIGNISGTPNASSDRVWINDATDANVSTSIFDIGFNGSMGDTSHQTFANDFPAPNVVDFNASFTDLYTPAHGLSLNQVVQFDGTLPPEFSLLTNYYVVLITDVDHFQVSDTYMGSPITPSVTSLAVPWAIFGADLAGGYNLGFDPVQLIVMTTDGGDTVNATFTLSDIQVTWDTGLTVAASATVEGSFPFSALTGGSTSYQYNTDGRHAFILGMDQTFDFYINGFAEINNVLSMGSASSIFYNTVLSAVNMKKSFSAIFDGSGGVLAGPQYVSVKIPYNCIITDFFIHSINPATGADLPGTMQIDVKRAGVSMIGAGNPPKLAATASQAQTVSHWTRTKITAGDEIFIYINGSVTSCVKTEVTFNTRLN